MEHWSEAIPFWKELTHAQQSVLSAAARERDVPKGTLLHGGSQDCVGLLVVRRGRLRAYTLSDEGKELTLYRLQAGEICLFSAACIFGGVELDVLVEAEEDTATLHIPSDVYQNLMETSIAAANYTNRLMAGRFSDVMWLMDQVLNKKLDARLAALLLEERDLRHSDALNITHEQLGNHLGSVREVVTRMLKHFQGEGWVSLRRGCIHLTDLRALRALAAASIRA